MCKVVNINKEPFDIYIGRHPDHNKGKWGNPFSHKEGSLALFKTSTRKEAIDRYEQYLLSNQELMDSLHELQGKTLGCWCKTKLSNDMSSKKDKSCHGDILKKYVDKLEKGFPATLF